MTSQFEATSNAVEDLRNQLRRLQSENTTLRRSIPQLKDLDGNDLRAEFLRMAQRLSEAQQHCETWENMYAQMEQRAKRLENENLKLKDQIENDKSKYQNEKELNTTFVDPILDIVNRDNSTMDVLNGMQYPKLKDQIEDDKSKYHRLQNEKEFDTTFGDPILEIDNSAMDAGSVVGAMATLATNNSYSDVEHQFSSMDVEVPNGMQYPNVYAFFIERHIAFNDEWLENVIKFITSKKKNEDLFAQIFHQWKYSNLKESTYPFLSSIKREETELTGTYIFQIQSILDIGISFHSQFKKLTYTFEDNSDFQCNETEELDNNTIKEKSCHLHQLVLSDGETEIKALEYKRMPELSVLITPGTKIILYGLLKIRRNILLLTSDNCQILGGDDEDLMKDNRSVSLMAKILKQPLKAN